jgi:hypothetical protein
VFMTFLRIIDWLLVLGKGNEVERLVTFHSLTDVVSE